MIIRGNYEKAKNIYPNIEEFVNEITIAYQDVIKQFYDAGFGNLQIDNCTQSALTSDASKDRYQVLNMNLDEIKALFLILNNLALENKSKDTVINKHI